MTKEHPRHLRWGLPEAPTPKHPYRDSMLVYGFFAAVVVLLAWVTGGSVTKALGIAAAVWAAASIWSIARWRQRLQREAAAAREEAEDAA
jgi:membrane protein implicated in regulation of membrane protease activity